MSRKQAVLKVSYDLLIDALKLPKDTKIIRSGDELLFDQLKIVIEHPDFEEVEEGKCLPTITPSYFQVPKFEGWD